MSSVSRKGLFLLFWILTLLSFSCVQKVYLDPISIKFFPDPDELKPDLYFELKSYIFPPKKETIEIPILKDEIFDTGENYIYLKNFYDKLHDLEINKNKVVRILHFGDSIIWADIITSKLKNKFQADFGDGGRGAVPVYYKLERAFLNHGNPTSESSFIREKAKPWGSPNHNIGFLGESFLPLSSNSTSTQILGKDQNLWLKAGLILHSQKSDTNQSKPINININYGNGKINSKEILYNDKCELFEYSIPPSDKVSFNFEGTTENLPFIDAITLETSYGVSYSPVSVMGLELNDQLISDEEKFECGIKKFKPDLIVLQYGVNESQNMWLSPQRNQEFYINSTRKVLNRFKDKTIDSSILIIGPVERVRPDSNGKLITMPEMLKIREVFKKVSKEYNVSFYDSFLAMGGEGKSGELTRMGIIQQDRTHLTRSGGDYLAELFYTDFYNQYQNYLGHKNNMIERKKLLEKKEANRAVNFTSKAYFYFFILVIFTIYIVKKYPYLKLIFFLLYSYYFYISLNLYPILLLLFSTITDYFLALKIESSRAENRDTKIYLFLSLFFNLGLLFIFKYLNFSIEILNNFMNLMSSSSEIDKLEILLPVGISFYTFQTLSYTIDVYKGNMRAETNLLKFGLFVTFFPQLVAGPIVRANHFLPSINPFMRHFSPSFDKFSIGVFFIFCGLFKKLGADWLGVNLIDRVYSAPEMYSSLEIITAIYGYAFQIYGDFSGYTDIAIGSAMIIGFNLTLNFNRPYQSSSINEFWRRWHISLGSWFRDYLYIALGGNRGRVYLNLFITMFLCGLWHGASFNFVIWGMYHGTFLAFERWLKYPRSLKNIKQFSFDSFKQNLIATKELSNMNSKITIIISNLKRFIKFNLNEYFRVILTFQIVVLGWVLFRMESIDSLIIMIDIIFSFNFESPNLDKNIIFIIIAFGAWHLSSVAIKERIKIKWINLPASIQGIIAGMLSMGVYNIGISAPKAFIYFQF